MKVAGMQRLSEIDQQKTGFDLMKISIKDLSEKVNKLYFLKIGNIDDEIYNFIENLSIPYKIIDSDKNYGQGWVFKNNESLDDLYKSIDENFDWILYPDTDDILSENTLDLLYEADKMGAETIRWHFIECLNSPYDIIEIKEGYPIGPHFKAVKHKKDITFIGSDGFNEPTSIFNLKRFETEYCVRHLRYASDKNIQKRKSMNYFQDYFLKDHNTIKYKPNQKINYYKSEKS